MKDIDTETPTTAVVWPSWCYSDDIRKKLLKANLDIAKDTGLVCEPDILESANAPTEKEHLTSPREHRSGSKPLPASQAIIGKMLSERSLLLSGYNNNSIDNVKKNREQSKTPPPPLSTAQAAALSVTPTTTAAAAAAYLYLEKVKNERMSPRVTAAQIDSLKDAIMESSAAAAAVAAAMVNNNNCSSINNNNSNNNNSGSVNSGSSNHSNNSNSIHSLSQIGNSLNNTSDELHSHSHSSTAVVPQQHQRQQSTATMHINSNHVKRERLSPNAANGDLQSAISRSRSTTPSSFRGTSPQHSVHSSPSETVVPMHNLSTNLLNSIQQATSSSGRHNSINFSNATVANPNASLPTDFSTRNYSDFMRCLAAKYNNTNPNDTNSSRRQAFFDATATNATKKTAATTTTATKGSFPPQSPSTSLSKEVTITTTSSLPPPPPLAAGAISPGESVLTNTQQSQMAAAAVASATVANAASGGSVSPFMTSFLSSLPFAQGIFPPLIDMSSTQALITLARAAKESEIQNILHLGQTATKRNTVDVSPSPSPSLNMALQQAAQFISPALIYSAQLQKQQLVSRQSSPRSTNITNSSSNSATPANSKNPGEKRNASPLDLSSQPPASKRSKAESTSSQSSNDGLLDVTIKRRASNSTPTTTPSPPPITEKSTNPAGPPAAAVETTTTAITPTAVGSSPSMAPSTVSGVRQCQAHSEEVNSWTVHDVCAFVGSIDICAEYVKHFRDQSIDGSGLPLLTEDHLVNSLGMKLGPALKLRSMLAKKLGGPCPCVACVAQAQQMLALQTSAAGMATPTNSGTLNVTAITTTLDSGGGSGNNSHQHKSANTSNIAASTSSSNNSGTTNSSSKSTTTTTAIAIANNSTTIEAATYNSIEGGTPNAVGISNCIANIATHPLPAYSNCSSNYNNSGNNNNNRDDISGSSSSTS